MPEIGEIRSFRELGTKDKHKKKWVVCPVCGLGRWVILTATKREGFTGRCHQCNVIYRGGYRLKKGGKWVNNQGYVQILLQPDDFFYQMVDQDGYVAEHRLVMAKFLGRCLQSWELVHHKGTKCPKGSKENRGDNREENLQLVTDDRHKQITILENKVLNLKRKNESLRLEIKRLKRRDGNA